jgi:Holliday junction resolvasome RuvABC endonuclease subunit
MAKKDPGNWYPISEGIRRKVVEQPAAFDTSSKEYVVLAIDPGTTNLAACILARNARVQQTYTTKFAMPKLTTTYQKISYLENAIQEWLSATLHAFHGFPNGSIDLLIKESIAHGYPGGVADAGRVQHMLESFADFHDVPFVDVNPSAMRAYIGSKAKSDTKLAVYKKFHVEFDSEDECDAYAIAMTGLALISGEYKPKTKK